MPFHIVQTKKNQALYLEAIPSRWVTYNEKHQAISWWPKTNLRNLIEQENSVPDETFYSVPCVVKRLSISTKKEADEMIVIMSNQSDTDNNEVDMSNTKKVQMRKGANTIASLNQLPDFNEDVLKQYLNMDTSSAASSALTSQTQSVYTPIQHQIPQVSKVEN